MSRIAPLVGNLIGSETADELLVDIMEALGDSVGSIPEVGNDASLQSIPKFLERKFLTLLIPVYFDKYDSTAGVNEEKVTRK